MFGLNDPFGFNNHMNSIMNSFMMDPFGPPPQQQQQRGSGGNNQRSNNNQISQRNNNNNSRRMMDPFEMMMASPFDRHNAMMARHHNPFSMVDQMMANMNGGMMRNFDTIHADPSSQVYSSSSVITYSNSGDGKPRVYQESSETRQGPGGVKETKKMVRDTEKGVEKLAIGHHIGDRAHIIERQKYKDGKMEEVVNLENLDDEEVGEFNREFEDKITTQMRYNNQHHHSNNTRSHHHLNNNHPLAIDDGHSRRAQRDKDRKSKSKSKF